MPTKLPIWDQRMLELIELSIVSKTKGITNLKDFVKVIGIKDSSTITQIRNGKQSFRHQHLMAAAKAFGISMDWFYGFTNTKIRKANDTNPLKMLKEATRLIEKQYDIKK